MVFDYTYKKYQELLDAIAVAGYNVLTVHDYLKESTKNERFIIIRHDVDLDPVQQIRYAKLEQEYGFSTSYYYRYTDDILKDDLINEVHSRGHEIGLHYESLTKARGDFERAIEIFDEEITYFKDRWKTTTICPHGGSFVEDVNAYTLMQILKLVPHLLKKEKIFSNWNSKDLWKQYSFEKFDILGDAYLSIDFNSILYLSDTGRSWDNKYKKMDKVESSIVADFPLRTTNDIIRMIKDEKIDKMCLLVHFEQWKDKYLEWIGWYIAQIIRRTGKKLLRKD